MTHFEVVCSILYVREESGFFAFGGGKGKEKKKKVNKGSINPALGIHYDCIFH